MKQSEAFGLNGIVPGSAEEIAFRRKQYEQNITEENFLKMEDFPGLLKMYKMLKKKEHEKNEN